MDSQGRVGEPVMSLLPMLSELGVLNTENVEGLAVKGRLDKHIHSSGTG